VLRPGRQAECRAAALASYPRIARASGAAFESLELRAAEETSASDSAVSSGTKLQRVIDLFIRSCGEYHRGNVAEQARSLWASACSGGLDEGDVRRNMAVATSGVKLHVKNIEDSMWSMASLQAAVESVRASDPEFARSQLKRVESAVADLIEHGLDALGGEETMLEIWARKGLRQRCNVPSRHPDPEKRAMRDQCSRLIVGPLVHEVSLILADRVPAMVQALIDIMRNLAEHGALTEGFHIWGPRIREAMRRIEMAVWSPRLKKLFDASDVEVAWAQRQRIRRALTRGADRIHQSFLELHISSRVSVAVAAATATQEGAHAPARAPAASASTMATEAASERAGLSAVRTVATGGGSVSAHGELTSSSGVTEDAARRERVRQTHDHLRDLPLRRSFSIKSAHDITALAQACLRDLGLDWNAPTQKQYRQHVESITWPAGLVAAEYLAMSLQPQLLGIAPSGVALFKAYNLKRRGRKEGAANSLTPQ